MRVTILRNTQPAQGHVERSLSVTLLRSDSGKTAIIQHGISSAIFLNLARISSCRRRYCGTSTIASRTDIRPPSPSRTSCRTRYLPGLTVYSARIGTPVFRKFS